MPLPQGQYLTIYTTTPEMHMPEERNSDTYLTHIFANILNIESYSFGDAK
jgi:hypothetical protein